MIELTFPATIATERLLLRPYRLEDARMLLGVVQHDAAKLLREFAPVARLQTPLDAESFIENKSEQWKLATTFCYGLWQRDTAALVGQLQVKNIVWDVPSAELGYFIATSSQRQGFAVEAVQAVLNCAFERLGFKRIFVRILPDNAPSLALARKLGFQHEGVLRKAFRCGFGELHDVHCLSMTAEDLGSSSNPYTNSFT